MAPSPWEMFNQTADLFKILVPDASPVEGTGQYQISVEGNLGTFRLKRGKDQVNQNHIHYGEPLVVHVPDEDDASDGSWYVLSVKWLISYALSHPDSRQHTVHSLDCFMFSSSQLSDPVMAKPADLSKEIIKSIKESNGEDVRRAVRAIRRARIFSITHYEEAADTAAVSLGLPIPK